MLYIKARSERKAAALSFVASQNGSTYSSNLKAQSHKKVGKIRIWGGSLGIN
jgi:hypothetical protein